MSASTMSASTTSASTNAAWWLSVVATFVLLACTSTSETRTTTPRRSTPRLQVRTLAVEHVPLPSDGLVHLSLWIEGGSFDADPPAAATIAAWSVESTRLSARATPDGIELSLRGAVDELDALLAQLAGALAVRELSDARHRELAERLVDSRRRALASPTRRADELALRTLLGPAVSPFEGEPTRADVERFLAASFGPERALLVVIGELDEARLQRAIELAFDRAPSAAGLTRGFDTRDASEITTLERGPLSALSIAATLPSIDDAWGLARALGPEAKGAWVYPHRGGASLILRAEPTSLPLLAAQARFAVATSRTPPDAPDVATLAEHRGLAWLAERHDEAPLSRRVAIGGVCAEERGEACVAAFERARAIASRDDAASSVGPATSREEEASSSARVQSSSRAQRRGRGARRSNDSNETANDGPHAEGPDPRSFEARATNGAWVRVESREGPLVLALRFSTDGTDASSAMVLAHVLAARCASEPSLEQVAPELDSNGLSIVARADPSRSTESLAAIVRCASTTSLREIDRVRLRALEDRRRSPERGWLAHALAPGALATVAPRGDARGLSRTFDPRAFASTTRVGARTTLALVGPVDARATAELGAHLLGFQLPGEPVTPARWGEAVPLVAERFEAPRVRLALGWRAEATTSNTPHATGSNAPSVASPNAPRATSPNAASTTSPNAARATSPNAPGATMLNAIDGASSAIVARAFADAVAARLGPEAELRWRDGGEGPTDGAWAAVAIDVAPEHVDAVIERARAVRGPSAEELARVFERERWAGADARVAALRLARLGRSRVRIPSAAEADSIVRTLRSGTFVIAVGRTQQARAWQRR